MNLRGASHRLLFTLLAFVPIFVLVLLLLVAPPDGTERSELLQFIGRFHPLSVHLPIALLLLVPVFEVAGRSRRFSYLLPTAGFVLGLATCAAVVATLLGWCLARAGGYSGPLMTQHMWGGTAVAAAALLCWNLRFSWDTARVRWVYPAVLLATVGLVAFTGYRGGQLAHGETHLTELMPQAAAALFRHGTPVGVLSADKSTVFGARVKPVFTAHCVTCHGPSRRKANLRLDTYEAVMRGGKHGLVIKPGEPRGSELFRRISLTASDEDVMPPDNRRLLSRAEVRLIERWIQSGASRDLAVTAIRDIASEPARPAVEVRFEEIDPEAVARQRAPLAAAMASLQQRFPNLLDYQSRNSPDVVVHAAWLGPKFGDGEVAALAALSDRIVSADFSSTAITDKSAAAIGAMKHLRTLRLTHTGITDATVESLAALGELEVMSLFDTGVSPAALPALARLPKLQRVYVGNTRIRPDSSLPMEIRQKLVF
jgi:uncharacterized membrane protein/mono/diheme cytochrome c family protein